MESSATVAHRVPEPALDPRRWKALALLCGAFFMFSEHGLQWVLSAYAR